MRLQILLWFLLTRLVLLPPEGTRAHWIQPLGQGSFSLNIGVGNNHRPVAKHEVQPVPAENRTPFCQAGCLNGWMSYGDHCYLYVQEQRPWSEAERTCQGLVPGGHLTSISSAEHNEVMVKLGIYLGVAQTNLLFWIGGNHQKGGSLQWTDGARTNFIQRPLTSLFGFVGGTIQRILNLNVHLCLQISLTGHGRWDGNNCQKRLPFICSYKPNLSPP